MASKEKIIEMIGLVTTMYPQYADKWSNVPLLVNSWSLLLSDYDDAAVTYGFAQTIKTSKYPPTPAEVIEQIKAVSKSIEPSDAELWGRFEKAVRDTWDQMQNFNFTFRERNGLTQGEIARKKVEQIYEELPPKVKAYVGGKGALMDYARQWSIDEDFFKWERTRFMNYMPIAEKRVDDIAMLREHESRGLLR